VHNDNYARDTSWVKIYQGQNKSKRIEAFYERGEAFLTAIIN